MNRIAVLYPGALGVALGKAIVSAGDKPITCLGGRSAATYTRASAANFVIVPSLRQLARESDLVVSLVPGANAVEVACRFAACVENRHLNSSNPVYVEANSVPAPTKKHIARILSAARIDCCDAAFLGPAGRIGPDNLMLLSGTCVSRVAPIFGKMVDVRLVGGEIGQAASLKMTIAILTKSLPALFLELICAAEKQGQLNLTLDLMKRLYPGIFTFLERTLPTYPAHISRRVHELSEVRDWLCDQGQNALMTTGAVTILDRFRVQGLTSSMEWKFEELVRTIAATDFLSLSTQA